MGLGTKSLQAWRGQVHALRSEGGHNDGNKKGTAWWIKSTAYSSLGVDLQNTLRCTIGFFCLLEVGVLF